MKFQSIAGRIKKVKAFFDTSKVSVYEPIIIWIDRIFNDENKYLIKAHVSNTENFIVKSVSFRFLIEKNIRDIQVDFQEVYGGLSLEISGHWNAFDSFRLARMDVLCSDNNTRNAVFMISGLGKRVIIHRNKFIWFSKTDFYADVFSGDYGQSLAIRYLRERIGVSDAFTLSEYGIGSIDNLIRDVGLIYEFLVNINDSQNIQVEIQNGIICYFHAVFAGIEDEGAGYEVSLSDYSRIWEQISSVLKMVEEKRIMALNMPLYMKDFMLGVRAEGLGIYNETKVNLRSFGTMIYFIESDRGNTNIEGGMGVPSSIADSTILPIVNIDGSIVEAELIDDVSKSYKFGRIYRREIGFKLCIAAGDYVGNLKFGYKCKDEYIYPRNLRYHKLLCPLSGETQRGYYYSNGVLFKANKNTLKVVPFNESEIPYYEKYYREELLRSDCSDLDKQSNVIIRDFYYLCTNGYNEEIYNDLWKRLEVIRVHESGYKAVYEIAKKYVDEGRDCSDRIWILMDRPDRADDNGEALFRYLSTIDTTGIDIYFCLSSECDEYDILKKYGKIIEPLSLSHRMLHSIAEYVISSQMQEFVVNPYNDNIKYLKDYVRKPRFVFLQHGVIHNYHGQILGRYGRNFYGFVVSAGREYDYIASDKLHYDKKDVWLTGLARFDRLYSDDKRIITIMPTWRKWLTKREYDDVADTMIWNVKESELLESEFFMFYRALINDERLHSVAKEYGYTIAFLPHVHFLKYAQSFVDSEDIRIYDYEQSYRKVFAESSLVVTDYSSAVFDFAYLYKPIVYCQFDKQRFYQGHTVKKGYFDFEKDGFGEVTYDKEDCVNKIINYMQNECRLKDIYRKRIDSFFAFHDKKCCARIYHKLVER